MPDKTDRIIALFSLLVAAACTDMSTPAALSHEQILAVRADPPVVEPGGMAALSVLVAGPEGIVQPAEVIWGDNVETDGKGQQLFVAPAQVAAGGELVLVDVAVALADGVVLAATKNVGVGVALPEENPTIAELRADGTQVRGTELGVACASTVALELKVSPPPSDAAIYAWYSTAGEIELYRRSPTELMAPEDATSGALIAVVRDGLGVAWRVLSVQVE